MSKPKWKGQRVEICHTGTLGTIEKVTNGLYIQWFYIRLDGSGLLLEYTRNEFKEAPTGEIKDLQKKLGVASSTKPQ